MYKEWEMVWEDCMGQRQLRENGRSSGGSCWPAGVRYSVLETARELEERFESITAVVVR
jgi:hypothetical protein